MFSSLMEDEGWLDPAQADMSHAACSVDPSEGPAVGVEHRQRPEVPVRRCQVMMGEGAHDVHVGVAMGDHHAFWARRRAAGVIDR